MRVCLERTATGNRRIDHIHTVYVVIAQPQGLRLQCRLAPRRFDTRRVEHHLFQRQCPVSAQIQVVFQPDGIAAFERNTIETCRFQRCSAQLGLAVQLGGESSAGRQITCLPCRGLRQAQHTLSNGVF